MEKERRALTEQIVGIIFSSLNLKNVDRASVTEGTPLVKGGLNLDSIDILELVVNFERAFNFKVSEAEDYSKHFMNVGSIVDFVESKSPTVAST